MTSTPAAKKPPTKRSQKRQTKQPSAGARRTGYVFAVLVNAALLFGVNVWPGWDVLPFLTADFTRLLTLLNVSLVVSLTANVVYLLDDATRVKALGDLVTLTVSLVLGLRFWQVFPFDFGDATFDWSLVFRVLLGLGIFGVAAAIVISLVSLVTGRPSRT